MKRTLAGMLALMLMLLCGCAHSGTAAGAEEPISLEAVYQGILDAQGAAAEELVFFPEEGTEALESLYPGLTELEVKQVLCYLPPVTGYACEILLLEVAEADVDAARAILQARIDTGAADRDYPESAVLWQNNAQVQSRGNYLCLVALPDGCTIPEDVFAVS